MSKEAEEYVKNNVFVDADSEIEYKMQAQRFVEVYDAGKSSNIKWHYTKDEKPDKAGRYLAALHPKTIGGEFTDWNESTILVLCWRVWYEDTSTQKSGWVLPAGWNDDESLYAWAELLEAPPLPKESDTAK